MMNAFLSSAALSLSSSIELSIAAKATVMLLIGLAAAHAAVRVQASIRHLLLAATFATLVALPIAVVAVPAFAIPVAVPAAAARAAAPATTAPAAGAPPIDTQPARPRTEGPWSVSWSSVARWTWIGGAAAMLLSLAAGLWRTLRIRRTALPRTDVQAVATSLAADAGIRRRVDLLEHERVLSPLTCGVRTPAIVLPFDARDWDDAALRRALVHELEHVRRGDWLVQVMARAACAVYWFHPLVWVAWHRLCLEAERACDDSVVRTAASTDYADQLVLLARRLSETPQPAMLGMANRSDLAARVAALLDDRQKRGRAGIAVAAAAALAAAAIVAAIAPVRAVAHVATITNVAGVAAEPEQRTGRTRTSPICRALYEAAEEGETADIEQLIKAGGNLNCAVNGDGNPLIGAARRKRVDMVQYLLDRGADPNMGVPGDGSALIVAAKGGALDIVRLLLDRGANIDLVVDGDENALIQASATGRFDVVRLLVSRGADINARVWVDDYRAGRRELRTPLRMAQRGGHADVAAFLISAGARE